MKTQLLSFTLFLLFSLSFSVAQDVNKQSDLLIHSTSSLSVSNISFYAENKGPVVVRAYSIDGKQVAVINQNLNSGKATFSIELPKGIYIVQVVGNGYNYSSKIISNSTTTNKSITLIKFEEFSRMGSNNTITSSKQKVSNYQQKPIVTTSINSITSVGALFQGNVTDEGAAPVTAKGFLWGTSKSPVGPNPRNPISEGVGLGAFSREVSDLTLGTIYYVRAYARNIYGTSYGNEIAFRAIALGDEYGGGTVFYLEENGIVGYVVPDPHVYVTEKTWQPQNDYSIVGTDVSIGSGMINSQSIVSLFGNFDGAAQYCNNLIANGYDDWFLPSVDELYAYFQFVFMRINNSTFPNDGWYLSSSEVPNMINKIYVYPHIATGIRNISEKIINSDNMYSEMYYDHSKDALLKVLPIRKFPSIPVVSTSNVTKISNTYAESNYQLISNNDTTIRAGLCWSIYPNPTVNDNIMLSPLSMGGSMFIWQMNDLQPNTTYYVRAFATNRTGTGYGNIETFTTQPFDYSIGQTYQGGIIGYIFGYGESGYVQGETHGIIVSRKDLRAEWGCEIFPNTSTNIGDGLLNTNQIVSQMQGCTYSHNFAAKICNELDLNGYSDWYLPSLDELGNIYLNLYEQTNNLGYFSTDYYWTSSSNEAKGVWLFTIPTGSVSQIKGGADLPNGIRAMRNF